MRGTWYLSAWRHTVSVWGSTPLPPSNTATAPSSTRRLRSTSMVKSTWPGVSMMLMRWLVPLNGPEAGPVAVGRGGGDGDAALLLLDHEVHRGGALVDLAHLVVDPRVEEDPLGHRGLARVDVGHDPDVASASPGCSRGPPSFSVGFGSGFFSGRLGSAGRKTPPVPALAHRHWRALVAWRGCRGTTSLFCGGSRWSSAV
jgi:hypothetical protein